MDLNLTTWNYIYNVVTLEYVFIQSLEYSFAIVLGELLFRILTLLAISDFSKILTNIDNVFSNRQNQSVEKTELQTDTCSLVSKVLDWLILRSFQIIDNQLESGDILDEHGASLGPGLAVSYLYGFLLPVLSSGTATIQVEARHLQGYGDNVTTFDKLLLLLPADCELSPEVYQQEGVYRCPHPTLPATPTKDCGRSCPACGRSHHVLLGRHHWYGEDIWRTLYWVFEHTQDEQRFKAGKLEDHVGAAKIFLVMDFPSILHNAMGPDNSRRRGWKNSNRRRNLLMFEETIKKYLDSEKNR